MSQTLSQTVNTATKSRILLLDEDRIFSASLAAFLEREGYDAPAAESAEDAFDGSPPSRRSCCWSTSTASARAGRPARSSTSFVKSTPKRCRSS